MFHYLDLCCSSQEEHVLKLIVSDMQGVLMRVLLLARGACIETSMFGGLDLRESVAPRKRSMY